MKMKHKIGLIDVDNTGYPNLFLMKIARYFHEKNVQFEWYTPFDGPYDFVFVSKVFSFTPDINHEMINSFIMPSYGGSGYVGEGGDRLGANRDLLWKDNVKFKQPLYDIYPNHPKDTAMGFLSRGCCNDCEWCVVPKLEGKVRPEHDIEQIMIEGRTKAILMDNNILACGDYANEQFVKIIDKGYRIDFNQGLDARLVTRTNAELLAKIKWMKYIRFGCDTDYQIIACENAIKLLKKYGYKGRFFLYIMITPNFKRSMRLIDYWRDRKDVVVFAQPERPFGSKKEPAQWMKDMARWCNRKHIFKSVPFEDYIPRAGVSYKDFAKQF